jgi:heptosyltransferase I
MRAFTKGLIVIGVDTVLVRMDRIGDLVVSLPVDEHPALGGQNVHWFITKGLSFVAEQAQPRRNFTEFSRGFSLFEIGRMVKWLKTNKPQQIVLLHAPWWVSLAAWIANVPIRMGRKSQWHSFLFLNLGVRQKRSESEKHESDYNFELIERSFCRLGVRSTANYERLIAKHVGLIPPNPAGAMQKLGLTPRKYRVVHPGMGGSALNWPVENYIEIIENLSKEGPVLITGTATDLKFIGPIKEAVSSIQNVRWMVDQLDSRELLDVLAQAKSVIAPSTGVLHLAASLGTPSFGIYSPRKMEHPTRWAPRGSYTHVVHPPANPEISLGPAVMKEITVGEVLSKLKDLEKTFRAS